MSRLQTSRSLVWLLIASFLLVAGLVLVQAQEAEEDPVLVYRQKLMKGHGASMGSIGDILKYKLPYSPEHIATHAKNINMFSKLIPDAFEKKSPEGMTDAKPEVWANWDDFVAKSQALGDASAKLADAASGGGEMRTIMPHVKGLGDACRGCHNTYRKPEEECFKRD